MGAAPIILTGLATALALASVGGGLYEFLVVDPSWPKRQDIIQPARGGISRKRFWMPAHIVFELSLLAALFLIWQQPETRFWLLLALGSHVAMRIWSGFDFIPKALAFERYGAERFSEADARRWTRRSLLRLPLDLVTGLAMMLAFVALTRLG